MTLQEYISALIGPEYNNEVPFRHYKKKFDKNSIITDYGQIENKMYFLEKGIVEVSIMQDDEVKILEFFFENSPFCSYTSLLANSPSDVQVSAFTECIVEVIDYEELKKAYKHSLLANKLGRIATEKLYLKMVKSEKQLLTLTAEERYIELLKDHPKVISQIPIKNISKYLGIRPESLSRIRKKIIS